MGTLEVVGRIAESPITALIICLLLGATALSGKLSLNVAHSLLAAAILVGIVAIFRSEMKDPRLVIGSICGVVALGCVFSYWMRPPRKVEPPHPAVQEALEEKPPTLEGLFTKDLPNTLKLTDEIFITWKKDGSTSYIKRQLYLDFLGNTKFVGFYIPATTPLSGVSAANVCMVLIEHNAVEMALEEIPKKTSVSGGYGGQMSSIQDLRFSGRVLIYHEGFMSITERADVIRAYASKHYDVQFMGPDYLGDQLSGWYREKDAKNTKQQ
jgi:hypothetical protein